MQFPSDPLSFILLALAITLESCSMATCSTPWRPAWTPRHRHRGHRRRQHRRTRRGRRRGGGRRRRCRGRLRRRTGPAARAVAAAAEAHGAWSQIALERPLTCATGLCHGCAVLVGRRGHRPPCAPASTARCSAATGSAGRRCDAPRPRQPGDGRLRLRRHRPRAHGVRPPRRPRRLRHPLHHAQRRAGDAPPRIVETPSGLVNAVGLQNPGLEDLPGHRAAVAGPAGDPVVVSVVGGSLGEYAELARRLGRSPGVAAIEVNLSAPGRRRDRGARRARAVPRGRRRGRRTPRRCRATCRCWPSSAPTWSAWSRRARTVIDAGADGRRGRQRASRPRCPTAARRSQRPGDPPARAALRGRGPRALPDVDGHRLRRHQRRRRRPLLPGRRRRRRPGRHRPAARPHRPPPASIATSSPTERRPHDLRQPVCTRPCEPAARSAPASTRTPRCCTTGGSTDDVAGLERFALTAAEALAPHVCGRQAAVGVLRALRQPRRRRARAGGRRRPARPARWSCSTSSAATSAPPRQAYADAYLDPASPLAADAITASPYLGFGSLDADGRDRAQARRGRLRARADLQQGGPGGAARPAPTAAAPSPARILDHLRALNAGAEPLGSFGAVVGATIGDDAGSDLAINGPILAPGYGAQGGTVADLRRHLRRRAAGRSLPSSSRELLRRARRGRAARRRAAAQRRARRAARMTCARRGWWPHWCCLLPLPAAAATAGGATARRSRTTSRSSARSSRTAAGRPDPGAADLPGPADKAPGDITRRVAAGRRRIEALQTALEDAGVDPASYDRAAPARGPDAEDKAAIDAAARAAGERRDPAGPAALDQEARTSASTPL